MREIKRQETMWAEMKPDCYSGPDCDEIRPMWETYAEGDKDASHDDEPLELHARLFPPGTLITVAEPTCPRCGELRLPIIPVPEKGPTFQSKCRCGFDWDAWVQEQYG